MRCCGVRLSPSGGKLDQVAREDASQASNSDAAVHCCNCMQVCASLASADKARAKPPNVTVMRAVSQTLTSQCLMMFLNSIKEIIKIIL